MKRICLLTIFVALIVFCASYRGVRADAPIIADLHALLDAPPAALAQLALPNGELNAVYAARDYKPVWKFKGLTATTDAAAFTDSLERSIDYHGLPRKEYPLDAIRSLTSSAGENDKATLDLLVTGSLLKLLHDLHGDTVKLANEYVGWNFHRNALDVPTLLAKALASGSVNDLIANLEPKTPAYTQLAAALKSYRAIAAKGGWTPIDQGPTMRPNDNSPRVRQLRARLMSENYLTAPQPSNDFFDDALKQTVIDYQSRNGLNADGDIGPLTLIALNTPVTTRLEQIAANMERWRQMPDDFPPQRYAVVNIAAADIGIFEDGKEIYRGPVVVGKPKLKTPFIQSSVRSMIINPSWHVPAKIARKDILPKLKSDPHYLEKQGMVIKGNADDPYGDNIDWASMSGNEFHFTLRQVPGDQNSLGHLKFDFDNPFAVYMHGTPSQDLFAKPQRNFSHGCIRLRDPDLIGQILLATTSGDWNTEKIESSIAEGKTRWVGIKNPMPLYVLYWTVFADPETGAINFRKDVYDYDTILPFTFTHQ